MPDINRSIFVAGPDMTYEDFDAELVGSLIARQAPTRPLYDEIMAARHPDGRYLSHAFMLGMAFTEHQYGNDPKSVEVKYRTRSWGMRRSVADKRIVGTLIVSTANPDRGSFVRYPHWFLSMRDCCYALTAPGFVYQQEKRETVWRVNERWAPANDRDNDPQAKARAVATIMDRLSKPAKGATMGRVPKPPIEDLITQTTRNKVAGVGFDYGAPREPVGTTLHSMAGTLESCINYFPGRDVEALTDYGIGNVPYKGTPFARIVQFNKVDGGTMIPWASGPVGPSRNNPNGRPEGDGPRFIAKFGIGGINSRLASIEHDDSTHPDGHVETIVVNGRKQVNPNAPTHAAQWASSIWLQAWRHDLAGQTADTFDWNMHHVEFVGRNYKTCPRERITDFTDEYQAGVKAIMRHFQEGVPYPAGGIVINGLRTATPPEGNVATGKPTISEVLREALSKPTPTGHTIHPSFHALWSLEMDGYPVLPAVGYTDGKIRQVFDNSMMEANADGSGARRGGLGQAFVRLSGGNYPDWEQIHPQVA